MNQTQKTQVWINQKIKVVQWDNTQVYQEYDISLLHSILLNDNPMFQELKQLVEIHNRQMKAFKQSKLSINHAVVKIKFIAALYMMLSEICLFKNKQIRQKYLHEVYKWSRQYQFDRKERPITATTTQTFARPKTSNTGRPISGLSLLMPVSTYEYKITLLNNSLKSSREMHNKRVSQQFGIQQPEEKIHKPDQQPFKPNEQQQLDYINNHRTRYTKYQIPAIRLKEYKRKQLDLKMENFVFPKEVKTNRIKYEKIKEKKIKQPQQQISQLPIVQQNTDQGAIGKIQGQIIQQSELKAAQQAKELQDANPAELQIANADQQKDEQQQAQIEEVPDKLRPKIRPYGNPIKSADDPLILNYQENRLKYNRNKCESQIRQNHQLIRFHQNWANEKCRWQKQMSRKKESAKLGLRQYYFTKNIKPETNKVKDFSNPKELINIYNNQGQSENHNTTNYQAEIDQINLKNHMQTYMKSLKLPVKNHSVDNNIQFDKSKCLSAYKSSLTQRTKRFSDIINEAQQKILNQTDSQLISIKQRLAKNKISINISTMRSAITNEEISLEKGQQRKDEGPILTGMQLLKNPFFKVSKKKKKKKKK